MSYSAKIIANYFIDLACQENREITPMKLIKLIYIAHAWHLVVTDTRLLREADQIEAWRYGPVIRSIYDEFKQFGGNTITTLAAVDVNEKKCFDEDKDTKEILNAVWEKYKQNTGLELSTLTHKKGTPWYQYYKQGQGDFINDQLIKQYYIDLLREQKATKGA